jgi:hypothetical protein
VKQREAPRGELALGVALVALLVVLHAVVLQNGGALWRDEANSVRFALMPSLAESFEMLRYDSLPLGETVALRAWSTFTTTDQGFRTFGFLVGLAILGALFWSGRLLGVRAPLLSLSLFALTPLALRFGDSIRPYGPGTLFVVTTLGLVRKLATDDALWFRIAAPVSAVLAVQFLYPNAFLVLGACAAGIAIAARAREWKRAGLVLGTGVLSALSLLPYLGKIRAAGEWSEAAKQVTGVGGLLSVVSRTLGSAGTPFLWVWTALLVAGVALVAIDVAGRGRDRTDAEHDTLLYAGAALAVSVAGFVAFILVLDLNTQPWYLLPLLGLAALCLDAIWAIALPTPRGRVVRLAVASVLALAALPVTWPGARVRFSNVDIVAAKLREVAVPGDAIVVSPWYFGVAFDRAYRGPVAWTSIPPMRDPSIHRYDLLKEAMQARDPVGPVLEAVTTALRSGRRVYVVGVLTIPEEGERLRSLPPATTPELLAASGSYIVDWMRALGYHLRLHATAVRVVSLEERGPVSAFEDLPVFVFEGWRP